MLEISFKMKSLIYTCSDLVNSELLLFCWHIPSIIYNVWTFHRHAFSGLTANLDSFWASVNAQTCISDVVQSSEHDRYCHRESCFFFFFYILYNISDISSFSVAQLQLGRIISVPVHLHPWPSLTIVLWTFLAFSRLERASRFWPIVITETILGNMMSVSFPNLSAPVLYGRETSKVATWSASVFFLSLSFCPCLFLSLSLFFCMFFVLFYFCLFFVSASVFIFIFVSVPLPPTPTPFAQVNTVCPFLSLFLFQYLSLSLYLV